MIRFWGLDEINIYSWYRFKTTSTIEHVSLRDSSTIWSYSRTISRTRSRTRHSTWRSLVSKQNSRGGLFEAFYRSLDQRSPSFSPTVYLQHRWRCEPGPLLATGGPDTYPAFRLLPLADPKANPRRVTKCVSRSRRKYTRDRWNARAIPLRKCIRNSPQSRSKMEIWSTTVLHLKRWRE